MQILNIDAFAQTGRTISFKGVDYAVEEPSVQNFIDNLKASESLEQEGESPDTLVKSFEQAVVAISQAIPTMPLELIKTLKLPAITAVLQFIRGELDGDKPAESAAGEEAKKPS